MKNFIQDGELITVTAAADVSSGDVVEQGSLIGVAASDALTGEDVVIQRRGVFTLAKTTGTAWTQGVALYWDSSAGEVTTVSTDNTLIGCAAAAADSAATTGSVLLDGAIR